MNTLTPDTLTATDVAASLQQADAYAHWLSPSTRSAKILSIALRLLTGAAARIAEHLEREERLGRVLTPAKELAEV